MWFLLACAKPPEPDDTATAWECPQLLRGVDVNFDDTRADLDLLGARAVHFWTHWDNIQHELTTPFLTMADVTDARIQAFADGSEPGVDWSKVDRDFDQYEGLSIVPSVGSGYANDMPFVGDVRVTPDSMGRESYLAHQSLLARAMVRRYAGRAVGWQIENEVNVALYARAVGIREGDLWRDEDFVDEVVATLSAAVRAEDPSSFVTTNLHTEITWEDHVERWAEHVDWVGLDAYPNYIEASPVRPEVTAERVARARVLSGGSPVIVLETGYPSAPIDLGFTEERQAEYFTRVIPEAEAKGACGVFYFKLRTDEENGEDLTLTENHWGMFRSDGSTKPVWDVMANHFRGG